jgi:hypothetical protein
LIKSEWKKAEKWLFKAFDVAKRSRGILKAALGSLHSRISLACCMQS